MGVTSWGSGVKSWGHGGQTLGFIGVTSWGSFGSCPGVYLGRVLGFIGVVSLSSGAMSWGSGIILQDIPGSGSHSGMHRDQVPGSVWGHNLKSMWRP